MKNPLTAVGAVPSRRRKIVVKPFSPRRETVYFLAAILTVILTMALRFALVDQQSDTFLLEPYQRWDTHLETKYLNLYRSLLASRYDVVAMRDQEGVWPEAFILAEETIPPFAAVLLPKHLRQMQWLSYDGGSWVDYLGIDKGADATMTVIFRLIDLHADYHPHPHPGVDYDPELSVAAQVWFYPQAGRPYPGERLPEAGWQWMVNINDDVIQKRRLVVHQGEDGVSSYPNVEVIP